tara:strand:- start:3319 stop:5127 length:1809 start_codon:yes stop_codon:yes gene_type:complete
MKKYNFKIILLIGIDYFLFFISSIIMFILFKLYPINYYILLTSSLLGIITLSITKVYLSIQSKIELNRDYWKFFFAGVANSSFLYLILKNNFFVIISIAFISSIALLISRYFWNYFSSHKKNMTDNYKDNIAIYGAGEAGLKLFDIIKVLKNKNVKFFIDDNPNIQGRLIKGIPVINKKYLSEEFLKNNLKEIIIAIPSSTSIQKSNIINFLSSFPLKLSTAPKLNDILIDKDIGKITEISIDEALGREIVEPKYELINSTIQNKIVLITGAGGSIGSELARQILNANPKKILILDSSEYALYKIDQELNECSLNCPIVSILGDITDHDFIENVFKNEIDIIYHAAAYKHVPLVEKNIIQSVKNNIYGLINLSKHAEKHSIRNFVLISSDKAVRPSNIMGLTKRVCEIILQSKSQLSKNTLYTVVRFGNVLNSSGSVIPLFKKQIKNGGPITLTHQDVTRYFMTIHEAAQLVIQSAAISRQGDIFILDMGKPVKIFDLAKLMIHTSGYAISNGSFNQKTPSIEIKITGLRPGEKLHEELFIDNDTEKTIHPKIIRSKESFIKWQYLSKSLELMNTYIKDRDIDKLTKILFDIANLKLIENKD